VYDRTTTFRVHSCCCCVTLAGCMHALRALQDLVCCEMQDAVQCGVMGNICVRIPPVQGRMQRAYYGILIILHRGCWRSSVFQLLLLVCRRPVKKYGGPVPLSYGDACRQLLWWGDSGSGLLVGDCCCHAGGVGVFKVSTGSRPLVAAMWCSGQCVPGDVMGGQVNTPVDPGSSFFVRGVTGLWRRNDEPGSTGVLT